MDIEQWNAFQARTKAEIDGRPRHNPAVQVAAFAAGWFLMGQYQKDKAARPKKQPKGWNDSLSGGEILFYSIFAVIGFVIAATLLG